MKRLVSSMLVFFAVIVFGVACSKANKSEQKEPEKSSSSSSDEKEDKPDDFLVIVNRLGTSLDLVIHELGEGTIHRDATTDEMTGREYQQMIFEDEPVDVYLCFDDNQKVNEIEVSLQGNDLEKYRDKLDEVLGGSSKKVTENETGSIGYRWKRNNIPITLWQDKTNCVIEIGEED